MATKFQTKENAIEGRKWVVVDAEGQVVGRLATKIAHIIRGKHKPTFTPHNDGGDFVVVINAEKIVFTGNKEQDKSFIYHTGYVAGIKEKKAYQMRQTKPEEIITLAVKGMLPKSSLGRSMISKLKVYQGPEHPHQAQQPTPM